MTRSLSPAWTLVDDLLGDLKSQSLVACFFDPGWPFEGDMLYTLGDNPADSITRDDLLAVSMLDVRFPPLAVRRLFRQPTRSEIEKALRTVIDADIWRTTDGFEAARSFCDLVQGDGVGPVTAVKLLARNRPRLIPIVDEVVETVTGLQGDACWRGFRAYLAAEPARRTVEGLRPRNVAPRVVPTLRLLDTAIWTWGSRSKGVLL